MARKQSIPETEQSKQLRYYHRKKQKAAHIQALRSDVYLWLRHNLKHKRYQAKKHGLPFDLDEDWLQKQAMMCAMTGQSFTVTGPTQPSFDQKIPSKGYTKENTQLICLWLNYAKSHWSESEIRAVIVEAAEALK